MRKRAPARISVPALCAILALVSPQARAQTGVAQEWQFPEAREFDFWLGEWTVTNRFLQKDGTWKNDGSAHVLVFPALRGKAVVEFWAGTIRGGMPLMGFSIRYFDRAKGKWVLGLNWPAPNRPGFGFLEGTFRHGRGEFYSSFTDTSGTERISRYTFSDIGPDKFRWDDGYSRDNGQTWKANWIMEYTRTGPRRDWPEPGPPFHTTLHDSLCDTPEARRFDVLEGTWEGTMTEAAGKTKTPARLDAYKSLNGCALFTRLHYERDGEPFEAFHMYSWLPNRNVWLVLSLDSAPETGYVQQAGAFADGILRLGEFGDAAKRESTTSLVWRKLGASEIAFEMDISADAGETWSTISKLEMQRRK